MLTDELRHAHTIESVISPTLKNLNRMFFATI